VTSPAPGPFAPGVLAQATGPLLSPWIVFPIAVTVLIGLAAHIEALRRSSMPRSRRRIRLVNAWVMLVAAALIAFGFGAAGPSGVGGRTGFVVVWSLVFALMGVVLAMACLDMLNTLRLARRQRRELTERMDGVRRSLADRGPTPHDEPRPHEPPSA